MITFMCDDFSFSDVIAISNRQLVDGDYYEQIKRVVSLHVKAIILREKDIDDNEYEEMTSKVAAICEGTDVELFVHSRIEIARRLGIRAIHLPISKIRELNNESGYFEKISVACHSIEDVKLAMDCGATHIILGTIFETDCKKGLRGKGLGFVTEIVGFCDSYIIIHPVVHRPQIFAIGGIAPENLGQVKKAGADGGCMMSYLMKI